VTLVALAGARRVPGIRPRLRGTDPYVALAPGHRVAGTIALLGERDPEEPPLAGPGSLRRATASELPPVEAALSRKWERWVLSQAQRNPRRVSSSTSSAFAAVTKSGPVGISSPRAGNSRCRDRSASSTTGR
jgi:hypothetical protein